MLVDGISISDPSQETHTCAQVIMYNTMKQRSNHGATSYKDKGRETPVMVYNTLKIYFTVHSKTLINRLFDIGLCVPYKRLLGITKQLYEGLMESFKRNKTFIPHHLRKGIFTVLVKDNIDINATSTFVTSNYHATSISILQFYSTDNTGN